MVIFRRQSGALRVGHADQEGNRQEEAADHDQGADRVGVGHRYQSSAHCDDHNNRGADDKSSQPTGDLHTAGAAQQDQMMSAAAFSWVANTPT